MLKQVNPIIANQARVKEFEDSKFTGLDRHPHNFCFAVAGQAADNCI